MYGGFAREMGQVQRPHLSNRNITPEELDALEAVLKLTERVADQVGCYTYDSRLRSEALLSWKTTQI